MKKRNIVILAIGIVILMSLIVLFFINKSKTKITPNEASYVGNTAGNLYNHGLFCEKNGYVYFSNSYDNGALYRMRPDESEMELIVSTETSLINVDKNYIYYYMMGSGTGDGFGYIIDSYGVNRANLDGTKAVTMVKSRVNSLLVLGNNLIYDDEENYPIAMNKMDLSTKESTVIIDHIISACCGYQGSLYYNETEGNLNLKSYNPLGNKIQTNYFYDVYQPIIASNVVYFIDVHDGYSLKSFNLATSTLTTISKDKVDMFNMSAAYIYYQTSGKNPQFKRVTLDGSKEDVIADGTYNSINLTSRYVYFKQYNNDVQTFKIELDGSLFVSEFILAKNKTLGLH